jgi:hypothetical protein
MMNGPEERASSLLEMATQLRTSDSRRSRVLWATALTGTSCSNL